MAKTISTALRLMRLLMACWQRSVLTLKDIQTICQDDYEISEETAYNYILSLQRLDVELIRLSPRTWYVQKTPSFPPFRYQTAIQSLYSGLSQRHPLLDRLLGQSCNRQQKWSNHCAEAMIQRQVCHIHTARRWIRGIPIAEDGVGLQVWDLEYELPLSLNIHDIKACYPQSERCPELLLPRVIVQFEITGHLANRFEPMLNDTILSRLPGVIRIANRCDNASALCKRLLRYQLNCKVLAPTRFKQFMLDELNWLTHGYFETSASTH